MWEDDLENTIYTIVKKKVTDSIGDKYPNLNFTTSDINNATTKFPTVYVHEMGASERSQTLDNRTVNAVNETIRVEVYSNKSQREAKLVMAEVKKVMKSMRFEIRQMPEFNNQSTVYRSIMQCNRYIASGDTLS